MGCGIYGAWNAEFSAEGFVIALEAVISAVAGLIVGSFLNVVIHRLPRDESLIRPGSCCPNCQRPIRFYENIPLLSYLALRGKCSGCHKPIAIRYPVVEALTALLFVATAMRFGFTPLLFLRDWPFVALLVAITFIDFDHRIIPNELSLGGLVLGLATSYWTQDLGILGSVSGAALGFVIFYGFAWSYEHFTGRVGLGGGDIKLLAMLGAFLGPEGVFTTILVSSILGSVLGLLYGRLSKQSQVMRTTIPFGPFLVLGALYAYLLGEYVWLPFTNPI